MDLRLRRRFEAGWVVVEVAGAVDVGTAPRLRQLLQEVAAGGHHLLLVDLDGVEFMGSFGLGVLVEAAKRARSNGGRLVVRCTRERTLQVLERTELDATFELRSGPQ